MGNNRGISIIVLVITIIIMIIVSGAVIITLTGTNIMDQADNATTKYNKQQYKQMIGNEYAIIRTSEEGREKTHEQLFEMVRDRLQIENSNWTIMSNLACIEINNEYIFTLLEDGTIKDGKIAILDIADGSIELKSNGYVQGTNPLVEYNSHYIITGTSTENTVSVMEEGTYNITIKDLNIDVRAIDYIYPINANAGKKATGTFVNIYIEGDNNFYAGRSAAGLGFSYATPNVDGVTNGSTLTIQGEGSLYAEGGTYGAGIGGGYQLPVANIIINSGNIVAKSGTSITTAIGGGTYSNVSNIIINGGNVRAVCSTSYGIALGAIHSNSTGTAGLAKGLIINGGNVSLEGGRSAIGGEVNSEDILITGGRVTLKNTGNLPVFGKDCTPITLTGGTVVATSAKGMGIGTKDVTQKINITGGSLCLNVVGDKYAVPLTSNETNVYLTEIQLQNVTEEVQVTSFTTSDNLSYGIKDMYTTSEGKLYVYLPAGERTITIKAGEKEYTGTVVTGEVDATESVTLAEK